MRHGPRVRHEAPDEDTFCDPFPTDTNNEVTDVGSIMGGCGSAIVKSEGDGGGSQ